MFTTVLEQALLDEWEHSYDRWADFRPIPGESEDMARYRHWLEWLAEDLAAIALAEHVARVGEVETDRCLAKLDGDGRLVVFYADQAMPILAPRRFTDTPRPRKRKGARTHAA